MCNTAHIYAQKHIQDYFLSAQKMAHCYVRTTRLYLKVVHQITEMSFLWSLSDIVKFPISANYVVVQNCPNIGDKYQYWWAWPSLALPILPKMDAPKTDIETRNAEQHLVPPDSLKMLQIKRSQRATVYCYIAGLCGTHLFWCNLTICLVREELRFEANVNALLREDWIGWRDDEKCLDTDEQRLESNQRVTKTGRPSVAIIISKMTSL